MAAVKGGRSAFGGKNPAVSGLSAVVGGSGAVPGGTKTAYTADAQPVYVDAGMPTTNYDPGVGYAGTTYFNSPPPPKPAPAPLPDENAVAQGRAQTAAMIPSVMPLVGPSYVTQPAYEQQAQAQLQAQLERENAAASLAAQKELAAQSATQQSAGLRERASLNDETFTKRLAALSAMGSAGTGESAAAYTPAFNEEAARATAFARAKDQAGKTAQASLRTLRDVLAGRGMLGSSLESDATAEIVGGAGGDINDFTSDQLILDLNRAASISDRESAAGLTRRGQDLGYKQSLLGLLNAGGGLY